MNLRQQAESDLRFILEDSTTGFGWPITITDPDGLTCELTGYSNDISQVIDPETGQIVSGRSATVALRIASIVKAGYAKLPTGVADKKIKPWVMECKDINCNIHTFKVIQSNPDRSLGILTCILEAYTTSGD
jgi:hypothetical protein